MHIQLQRGREIRQRRLPTPRFNTGKLRWQIGGLPGYMRQVGRKIDRILFGATADLQNAAASVKNYLSTSRIGPLLRSAAVQKGRGGSVAILRHH